MVKLPKLIKETVRPKKKKSGKGPGFYQYNKSKTRRGIAANNAEENSAQNINLQNETNEKRDNQSSAYQSSTYLKDINPKEYHIKPESETTANLEKGAQQCFLEKRKSHNKEKSNLILQNGKNERESRHHLSLEREKIATLPVRY